MDNTEEPGLNGLSDLQKDDLEQLLVLLLPEDPPKFCYCNLVEHEINVGSSRPVKQRYYPVTSAILTEMHRQLKELLAHDIVEKSNSGWSSPVVMIRKHDGSYHLCVDYRQVKKLAKQDAYSLPRMVCILLKLRSAKYLSTLDFRSAYHAIPLKANSRPVAFTVPGLRLFQYNRLPFVLFGAPASF